MAADPWHFERGEFTSRVLTPLGGGPGQALTLFAPRRTGKTEFLLEDLAPLAKSAGTPRGLRVVLAGAALPAGGVVARPRDVSPAGGTLRDRLRSSALALAPKLKLSAPAAGMFGQPFRRRVGAEIGEAALSAGRVQAALRRLDRAGLADTHTGRWALVDPEFAAWIREHDGERR